MKIIFKKSVVIILWIMFIAIMLTCSACCFKTKTVNALEYLNENAYDKSEDGILLYLELKTISFYISPSIQGDYRKIAEYAVERANTLSPKITVNITDSPDSNFCFTVVEYNKEYPEVNAMNYRSYKTQTGEIVKSNIQFVSEFLDNKSFEYKIHTALHEMLHTFGIGHIESKGMELNTVMTETHPEEQKYQMKDYSDLDRANINWRYGE